MGKFALIETYLSHGPSESFTEAHFIAISENRDFLIQAEDSDRDFDDRMGWKDNAYVVLPMDEAETLVIEINAASDRHRRKLHKKA